ncbi:MAG: GAF domain-containing protein [Chloroflexi bacterium]|nr:MAG: GAF domain-containing protein [Chloroflexota bacterium]
MTEPLDSVSKTSNDLRKVSDVLWRVSQELHKQTEKLDIAVEGTYAHESSDPRVRLLSEALCVSRDADMQLSRLSHILQGLFQGLQQQRGEATPYAAEAMETITSLKQERDEQSILADIARTLNSTLKLEEVLRLVMDRVIEFVRADCGYITLLNPTTGELIFAVARDKKARSLSESKFATAPISRSAVKRVITQREPILIHNVLENIDSEGSVIMYGIHSLMCTPLIVRDHCIGAVYVDSRTSNNLFGSKHLDLLLAFCNQAAIAIDNARLFADLDKATQQVKEEKQYMDNIFSSIANGVVTVDPSGIVTTFNAAAGVILHLDKRKVINQHYATAFQLLPQVGLVELFHDALVNYELHEHGTFVLISVDCEIPGRDAGKFNLNLYISSLRDTQGQHIGAALVIDDRTQLKRSEEEAKKIRLMFERYVHPRVVEQLIKDPRTLNLGGETKEISVLFADIRGYTSMSAKMAPKDVMNLVNRYNDIICEAIWEEEGTLTAFIGDAVMAIFNAPLLQKTHALRAVRAAWKMRLAVQRYQSSLPPEKRISFGIGVNTGLATVGNVGSQERMQNYTAIGDVVNVASRIQNHVTDNNILINEPTYRQVYRRVKVGQPFPLKVKNIEKDLMVYYLLGLDPALPSFQG